LLLLHGLMAEKFKTLPKLAWENISVGCVFNTDTFSFLLLGLLRALFPFLWEGFLLGITNCIGTLFLG
jgi:hypothetical protein